MLDRWFMQKLSPTGKMAYIGGQLAMLGLALFAMLGAMDMTWDEARGPFILLAITVVLGWGFVCTQIWPVEEALPLEPVAAPKKKKKKKKAAPTTTEHVDQDHAD
jgi:hypothetical protein